MNFKKLLRFVLTLVKMFCLIDFTTEIDQFSLDEVKSSLQVFEFIYKHITAWLERKELEKNKKERKETNNCSHCIDEKNYRQKNNFKDC
jgi:hypothetical protein